MSSTVRVQAARIPDRDRLLEALRDEGLDAEPEDEIGIVVPVGEGGERALPPGRGRRLQRRRAVRADRARGRDLHPPARRLARALEQRGLALADADAQRREAVPAARGGAARAGARRRAARRSSRADGRARSRRRSRSPSRGRGRARGSRRGSATRTPRSARRDRRRRARRRFARAACAPPGSGRCPSRAGRRRPPRCRRTRRAARRPARVPSPPTRSRAPPRRR